MSTFVPNIVVLLLNLLTKIVVLDGDYCSACGNYKCCEFVYKEGVCQYYDGNYHTISDLSLDDISTTCANYWAAIYSISWQTQCSSLSELIWPVGECGCPRCDCPPGSLCCYSNKYGNVPFNYINETDWYTTSQKIVCSDNQDMCFYKHKYSESGTSDPINQIEVSCSETLSCNNTLSMDIDNNKSLILSENDNKACYTFIESSMSTSTTCYCRNNECNNLDNINLINKQVLLPKNECYVTDSFYNEEYWINYVSTDATCGMCGVFFSNNGNDFDPSQIQMKCNTRGNCRTLLINANQYNDELYGCVETNET
eukprot:226889_1